MEPCINPSSSNQAMEPDQLSTRTSQQVRRTSNITTATIAPVPTVVKVYTKADTAYSLTVRDRQVILAPYNEDDPYQYWMKYRYSTVKDEEGFPSFVLVNRLSGQAMKHSCEPMKPVELVPFHPEAVHESILWTREQSDGFSYIRTVNNIQFILDASEGDKNHGGVKDGTTVLVWDSLTGDNQRWKIVRCGRCCCCS